MKYPTEKQIVFAQKLGRDVIEMTRHEASLVINHELAKRRRAAHKALEEAGLVKGALCVLRHSVPPIKVKVEKYHQYRDGGGAQGGSPPNMVTREVETGKCHQPLATNLLLVDKEGQILPVNLRELWYSFFPAY